MGSTDSNGGNGGFSLRKRSYMLKQLLDCNLKLDIEGGEGSIGNAKYGKSVQYGVYLRGRCSGGCTQAVAKL
eukprot:5304992-Ditylum_brightwellii.AAC.1